MSETVRITVDYALAAWEANGPTSLTTALMADALYGVREGRMAVLAECWEGGYDAGWYDRRSLVPIHSNPFRETREEPPPASDRQGLSQRE